MPIQTSLAMPEGDNLRERHAEHHALSASRSATFLAIIKHFGIESNMAVHTPKGTIITINASDVWAARKKFFARIELDQHSCRLTVSGDKLVELFLQWLQHEYSERYRYLVSEKQQQWLKRVVMLVVARHLMEVKYTLYLQGFESFADPWVCGMVCHLQLLSTLPAELARMTHHIMDDPEQEAALIEQFYSDTDNRMIRHQFALPETLPPLPEDTVLPFALLDQPEEEEDSNE